MKIYTNDRFYNLKEYQELKGLPEDKIGKYFSINEKAIKESTLISAHLIDLLDAIREATGKPMKLTSLHRTLAKQAQLKERGYAAASHSPHLYGCAADIDCKSKEEVLELVALIQSLAKEKDLKVRVGYKQYLDLGQTFVHLDLAPEVFSKTIFKFIPNTPTAFTKTITW